MGGKGSGGHNKKTIEQHIQQGTYRADRHGPLPPDIKALKIVSKKASAKRSKGADGVTADQRPVFPSKLQYPDWFDEVGRKEWDRVCNILYERGTLIDVNHATLEGYCAAYSRAARADAELSKGFENEIPIVVGRGENTTTIMVKKKKVEIAIAEKAWNQVKMFAIELGITSNENIRERLKDEMNEFLDSQAQRLIPPQQSNV